MITDALTTPKTDAGSYTANAIGLSNPDYKLPADTEKPFTIAQLEAVLNWEGDSFTYNGSAQGPKASVDNRAAGDACDVVLDGESTPKTDAGSYIARAVSLSNPNYKLPANTEQPYTIAQLEAVLNWEGDSFTYNAKAQGPAAKVDNRQGTDSCEVTLRGAPEVNAGSYTAEAVSLSNPNYKLPADVTKPYTIAKKLAVFAWDQNEFRYDRNPHLPKIWIKNLEPEDADTVVYTEGEEQIHAGSYNLLVTGCSNDNYELPYLNLNFQIYPIQALVKCEDTELQYNGFEQGPRVFVDNLLKGDNAVVSYSGRETEAGNYSAFWDWSMIDNPDTVTFNVTDGFQTIEPIDVTVNITGHNNTADYDGEEHVISGYDAEISDPLYKEADFSFSGTAEAKRTDAGTANMGMKPADFVNNNANFRTVTFNVTDGFQTIEPIDVTVIITGHNHADEFDGQEHSVSGYDVTIENPLYKEADFIFSGSASAKRRISGTTYMGLTADNFRNVNPNFQTVTFEVTDGYQTIFSYDALVTVTITGHTDSAVYDGGTHRVEGYDFAADLPLYTADEFTFSGEAAAERTEAGTTNMGLTPEQFTNISENFANVEFVVNDGFIRVDPREAELAWSDTDLVYNENPQKPSAEVTNLVGGDECEVTVSGEQTDAGSYTAEAAALSNPNYKLPENAAQAFVIRKADIDPALDFKAPEAVEGLVYNRAGQTLVTAGEWLRGDKGTFLYALDPEVLPKAVEEADYGEALPQAANAGFYQVWWMIRGDRNHNDYGPEILDPEIDRKPLEDLMIEITPSEFRFDMNDHTVTYTVNDGGTALEEGLEFVQEDGTELTGTLPGLYPVKVSGIGNYTGSTAMTWVIGELELEGVDSVVTGGTGEVYVSISEDFPPAVITWTADNPGMISFSGTEGEKNVITGVRSGGAWVIATITTEKGSYTLRKEIRIDYQMFETGFGLTRLWDPERDAPSFAGHVNLPATGFSAVGKDLPLAVRETPVRYTDLKMSIQIPTLDVDADLVGVPSTDTEWLVDELDARAGLLGGTSLLAVIISGCLTI